MNSSFVSPFFRIIIAQDSQTVKKDRHIYFSYKCLLSTCKRISGRNVNNYIKVEGGHDEEDCLSYGRSGMTVCLPPQRKYAIFLNNTKRKNFCPQSPNQRYRAFRPKGNTTFLRASPTHKHQYHYITIDDFQYKETKEAEPLIDPASG